MLLEKLHQVIPEGGFGRQPRDPSLVRGDHSVVKRRLIGVDFSLRGRTGRNRQGSNKMGLGIQEVLIYGFNFLKIKNISETSEKPSFFYN